MALPGLANLLGGGGYGKPNVMQQLGQQQFYNNLGQMGARLMAAGQGGIPFSQRASLMGSAFEPFAQGPPIGQALGLAQLQQYENQQKQDEAARLKQASVARQAQDLFSPTVTANQALAAGGGPTPQAASLMGQPSTLMSDLPPQQMAALRTMAEVDPQAAISEYLKLSTRTPPKPTTAGGFYQDAAGEWSPIPGYQEAAMERARAGATQVSVDARQAPKPPTGYRYRDESYEALEPIPGGPAATREYTEGQRSAAAFANRMVQAGETLRQLEESGYEMDTTQESVLRALPGGNYLLSPEAQQRRQAEEDWVRAKLRLESGAAIGVDEMENEIKTYFPQAGDSPEVIQQKARARKTAEENLVQQSAGAFENMFGAYAQMTDEQFLSLDIGTLTSEQREQYEAELTRRGF